MTDTQYEELYGAVQNLTTAAQQIADGLQSAAKGLQVVNDDLQSFKTEMREFKNDTTTTLKVFNEKISSIKDGMNNINQRINDFTK